MFAYSPTTYRHKYTLIAVVLGILFPVLSTTAALFDAHLSFTLANVITIQMHPIQWVVNTAPFFLGLCGFLIGNRQDRLQALTDTMEAEVKERTRDLKEKTVLLAQEFDKRCKQKEEAEQALLEVEQIFQTVPSGIALIGLDHKIIKANKSFLSLAGVSADEILNFQCDEVLSGKLCKTEDCAIKRIEKGEEWIEFETPVKNANGEQFIAEIVATPYRDKKGKLLGVIEDIQDVTERRKQEREIRANEKRMRTILSSLQTAIVTIDPETKTILDVNEAAVALIGLPHEQIINGSCKDLICTKRTAGCPFETLGGILYNEEMEIQPAEEKINVLKSGVTVNIKGDVRYIESFIDNTTQKKAEEVLRNQATRDHLTNLYNRRYLMDRLQIEFNSAKRYELDLALCICDLDLFKEVNDNHGHQAGDNVLKTFSEIITKELRSDCLPARWGGDEFVVVLPHSDKEGALQSMERIRQRFQEATFTDEKGLIFSLSTTIGIATFAKHHQNMDQLFQEADNALYFAKEHGRNRIFVADESCIPDSCLFDESMQEDNN